MALHVRLQIKWRGVATVQVEGRGISIADLDQVEGRGIWNWTTGGPGPGTGIQHGARTDHAMRAHNCLPVRHQAIVGLYILVKCSYSID